MVFGNFEYVIGMIPCCASLHSHWSQHPLSYSSSDTSLLLFLDLGRMLPPEPFHEHHQIREDRCILLALVDTLCTVVTLLCFFTSFCATAFVEGYGIRSSIHICGFLCSSASSVVYRVLRPELCQHFHLQGRLCPDTLVYFSENRLCLVFPLWLSSLFNSFSWFFVLPIHRKSVHQRSVSPLSSICIPCVGSLCHPYVTSL